MTVPRTLMLSWRASDGELGARVKQWVDLLKAALRVQFRNLNVTDPVGQANDRRDLTLALRDDKYTDFLGVYTVQYCLECEKEAGPEGREGENELVELARRLSESRTRRWLARLHVSPPWEAAVGPFEPWRDREAWTFLPGAGEDEHFRLGAPIVELDTDIYERCVVPLKRSAAAAPERP